MKFTLYTKEPTLEKATQILEKCFTSAKVVQVEVHGNNSSNPWLNAFGRSADDPDFDNFIEEISRGRIESAS